ncbi:VWA domain-containing protein [Frankia sp. AgB1.9]|uniref:VWA domain-containing protein n=1 Tax=unclassified Frankia TaxID=2632575 RepID=UPI001931A4C6|nr:MULTISPECIES: VWA domain-containing protein [unclassified Frankia]MBL7493621.1 VWA domain-containing protein [Frankia sp. AgW1.1]MBL7553516.1 VWA domain-containing protein [Frankia sp. AgB1.9]MBL7622368.1 VWA domain-containing protein [Frankia sp. AgB1.8]
MPAFVLDLATQLRQRDIPVTSDDLAALRDSLRAGFGWSSLAEFERLCICLWAKSGGEAEVIRGAFKRFEANGLPSLDSATDDDPDLPENHQHSMQPDAEHAADAVPRISQVSDLPPIPPSPPDERDYALVLIPQYPLGERTIAQTWRRLRRPVRIGPATELDVAETLRQRVHTGVVCPPALVPPRRNAARLLLLVDVGGSMRPYEGYVEHVCAAIRSAGRLDRLDVSYFHNTPGPSEDRALVDELPEPFGTRVDPVLRRIRPLTEGRLFTDPRLIAAEPLGDLLNSLAPHTATAVISDAGAARGHYDPLRLIDSLALAKALKERGRTLVWLNPAPRDRWPSSTAGQLQRHLPMFTLTEKGDLDRAVAVLHGRPAPVERPL